ncbi:hypothetical protein ACFQL1_07935 [Halomicroarcula sp. GCM10025709]|uniref:hypothetical protein n=1 Tax=Halomicroarcula sp. GCM10025709 TaxID=3252669 RepID=UPI00361261DB
MSTETTDLGLDDDEHVVARTDELTEGNASSPSSTARRSACSTSVANSTPTRTGVPTRGPAL